MKEEYTEIYRSKCDNSEHIIFKDNTISAPLFLVESIYYFPSMEKITRSAYVGGDAVKAMMEVVKQYEEAKAN
jgi:hypothetical protein